MSRFRPMLIVVGIVLCIVFVGSRAQRSAATSADGVWRDVDESTLVARGRRDIVPQRPRTVAANEARLTAQLAAAPLEGSAARNAGTILTLPMPDGTYARFRIEEAPIMEPALAARFPEITTYVGQGLDDATATVRLDRTPAGFHAMILSADGTVFIDPYSRGDVTNYISYRKADYLAPPSKKFIEEAIADAVATAPRTNAVQATGDIRRTYQLAMAATGEYTQFHGGTVAQAQAAIVTTVNRVVGVYEREVAVRLVLIAGNERIIYLNPASDPYDNDNASGLLSQNQANLDAVIGIANYDIGHVFGTRGGGLASLRSVCTTDRKAWGETGSSEPVGDPFDIDYVAHEIGHQFGGNHTFNAVNSSNCDTDTREPDAAYEPGSGSTIMAYAGICQAANLQLNSDDYFHAKNYDEITAFITDPATGGACDDEAATGNAIPNVSAGGDITIPANTPFAVLGDGNDANTGDALTYTWEQFDLGNPSPPDTDDGTRPIFRSFKGANNPLRNFPQLGRILDNANQGAFGESLPTTSRNITLRLTVRDNRAGGGGVNFDTMEVTVVNTGAAFAVTSPNTVVTYAGGSTQNITWNVAGTTAAPISCPNVRLTLSTNAGASFAATLTATTPNDGQEALVIPNTATTQARVKVECVTSSFFDISNTNFTITDSAPTTTPTIAPTTPPLVLNRRSYLPFVARDAGSPGVFAPPAPRASRH